MSRSGYCEDLENWELIRWRGQVCSALRGKRGQQFLRDLISALDALPEKKLIEHDLVNDEGYCAIGSVGRLLSIESLTDLDPWDHSTLSGVFNIAEPLVREVEFVNDEVGCFQETPEQRFERVREWAIKHLKEAS